MIHLRDIMLPLLLLGLLAMTSTEAQSCGTPTPVKPSSTIYIRSFDDKNPKCCSFLIGYYSSKICCEFMKFTITAGNNTDEERTQSCNIPASPFTTDQLEQSLMSWQSTAELTFQSAPIALPPIKCKCVHFQAMQVAMMTLTFQLSAIPKVDLAEPKVPPVIDSS
ncbi:uncharacterized protein LOC112560896 [Pomacea canaliculata]|uniref:uncharacterized protein LOC112560896 n=1 Tax=Pomacea canaliculata TaxID=400727 RepID=UPI000D726578|nr:uncharacterized protein LOC112560896 [Pomacea canaliculata]XP_025088791.1 uncharacterized protein LOC112560896 [Pomacea canaliculata]